MSLANVLPSAPPHEDERLYPPLPEEHIEAQTISNDQNFRLSKISEIEKEIPVEIEHYRFMLKKYKKVRKVIHYSVVCLGAVTVALSSGAVATSLTGVGIVIGTPVAAVAVVSGPLPCPLSIRSLNVKLISKNESMLWLLQNMTR